MKQEGKEGLAAIHLLLPGAIRDAPAVPNQHHRFARSRNGGVKQVPVVHEGMRFVRNHNSARELGALHLVNRAGIGQLDVIRTLGPGLDLNRLAVELDSEGSFGSGRKDHPHGAVHDAQVVVVPGLDDLVAGVQWRPAVRLHWCNVDAVQLTLQNPLQRDVQLGGAQRALVRRRQHLHITDEVVAEPFLENLTEFTPDDVALIGQLVRDTGAGAERAILDAFDGAITQMLGGIAANAQMKLVRDRRRVAQQLRGV